MAERINGILKYEFGLIRTIPNLDVAKKMVKQAVDTYNNQRLHYSLNLNTPAHAHVNQTHDYKSYKKQIIKNNLNLNHQAETEPSSLESNLLGIRMMNDKNVKSLESHNDNPVIFLEFKLP